MSDEREVPLPPRRDGSITHGMSPQAEGKGMSPHGQQRGMSPTAQVTQRPAGAPKKPADAGDARPAK